MLGWESVEESVHKIANLFKQQSTIKANYNFFPDKHYYQSKSEKSTYCQRINVLLLNVIYSLFVFRISPHCLNLFMNYDP